ncbi:WhiB family transcriptional regulator [uncultured Friedmanniella sp.]|uniref:WhiB family transcriptional regulator n=1 Tax=uncultured Friedmanniella sp. TaxID=335381 RepID=UPI0035CB2B61
MTASFREDWAADARCRGTGDILFAEGAAQRRVRVLCDDCPVRRECLAEALDNNMEWGVWGGMTERERRALLRQRPDVTSWRDALLRETVSVA